MDQSGFARGMSASRRLLPNACTAADRRFVPKGDIRIAADFLYSMTSLARTVAALT